MASSNFIRNVAIVGAGGHSGRGIAESLLKTGKHTVTALTRPDSKSSIPTGAKEVKVDYSNKQSLVEALKGQDALVITLNPMAPPDTQANLVWAAGEAGVSWVLPNEWSPDTADEEMNRDVPLYGHKAKARDDIKKLGKSSFLGVTTGFWYEWSLPNPAAFGFDMGKEVTFFDEGTTKISVSTWPQVGRAVAGLLSLPVKPEGGNEEKSLDRFRDKVVYMGSFTLSQRDMFESVLRVTGDKEENWKITNEPARERFAKYDEKMKSGDRMSFVQVMYTRIFFKERNEGNTEKTRGHINDLVGLPKEDLDEATKVAVQRFKEGKIGY